MTNVPASAEELRAAILARYSDLSKRMQQIGRHILDHPNDFALETLAVIAERSGVQPSAIVRFAQAFGYEGASQMQRLFRDGLISNNAALGYADRVRQLGRAADERRVEPDDLLAEFVEGNVLALNNLLQTTDVADLKAAVDAIADAGAVGVVGFRRSFPVASYLAYSLFQAEKRAFFIDGVGGLARQQLHGDRRGRPADRGEFPSLFGRDGIDRQSKPRSAVAGFWRSATVWSARSQRRPIMCCSCANPRCANSARSRHRCASRRRSSSTMPLRRASGRKPVDAI
jgi:hypothetical protein